MVVVRGEVQPGFERVREAFRRVLAAPGELGASFAVEIGGSPVVDLWGGIADRATGRRWEHDTAAGIYSGTKGLTAMCLLLLWDRGLIADDVPVSHYWPEFAAGKEHITVRQVLGHTAGVPGLRRRYSFAELLDAERFAGLVAAEAPFWPAGTEIAYHAKTFGAICAELVRRIDGRSIGRFLAEEFATPFGLDIWLGLPPELEGRVAMLHRGYPHSTEFALAGSDLPPVPPDLQEVFRAMLYDPPPTPPDGVNWNSPEAHRSEVASSAAIATARSVAHLYSALATDGTLDGVPVFSAAAVERAAAVISRGYPPLSQFEVTYGPGFERGPGLAPPSAPHLLAVGHTGLGGSVHGAWPELGVSFSFVMNRLRVPDDRAPLLLNALYSVLVKRRRGEKPRPAGDASLLAE